MSVVALSLRAAVLVDGGWAIDCRDLGLLARGLAAVSAIRVRLVLQHGLWGCVCLELASE